MGAGLCPSLDRGDAMNVRELKHALRDMPDDAKIEGFDPACDGEFLVRLVTYHARLNRVILGADPSEFSVAETILYVDAPHG